MQHRRRLDLRTVEAQGLELAPSTQERAMVEIVRTNDLGIIVFVGALLEDSGIPHQVADRTMAILDGSINAIRMRVLVPEESEAEARQLLVDADLGEWLRPVRS